MRLFRIPIRSTDRADTSPAGISVGRISADSRVVQTYDAGSGASASPLLVLQGLLPGAASVPKVNHDTLFLCRRTSASAASALTGLFCGIVPGRTPGGF